MNYRRITLVIIALNTAILAPAQTGQREQKALRIIHQNVDDFSKNLVAGNYEAVVAAYLPDGKIFPNSRPILSGSEAIREYWTPKAGATGKTVYHKVVPEEIKIEGQTAYDWGYYYGRTRQKDGFEIPWQGKYVIIWKEVATGDWKIYLDIWNNAPRTDSPYQSTETPALLGPGTISTALPEFASTFSRDGHTFWFNRTTEDRARIDLLESRFENGAWTEPQIPFFADTTFRNIDPWAISTQNTVLFASTRPLPGRHSTDYNLWQANLDTQETIPLPASVNSLEDEVYCSVSRNKNLYFARFSGRKANIYVSKLENGVYQPAMLLALPVPDSVSISNPAISPDESHIVFASGDLGGFGQADLFMSSRQSDGTWSVPQNLGAGINTAANDFAPSFSGNGETLFYTSEQPGVVKYFQEGKRWPGDLYHVKWVLPR